jgi:hypothetical protein
MVVGARHQIDSQPLNILYEARVSAHIGARIICGRILIVVKQYLSVGEADVCAQKEIT